MSASGLLVVLLALTGPIAPPRQQVAGALEGKVLSADDGGPVANAIVEARRFGAEQTPYVTESSGEGAFVLNNLQPGEYRLFVKRTGFVTAEYGQRTLAGKGTAVQVAGGQRVANLQVRLTATAAFHGRVIDGSGRPFVKAYVKALRVTYRNGQRTLSPVQTTITDDLGEYRIFWLTPGQYYVAATAPDWGILGDGLVFGGSTSPTPVSGTLGSRYFGLGANPLAVQRGTAAAEASSRLYSTVYFPNTTDERAAQLLDLGPSANLGGIDFLLAPVKTRRIKGVLVDADTGQPPATTPGFATSIWSSPRLDGPGSIANQNGEFDIQTGPGPAILTTRAGRSNRGGRIAIPAGETDITGIRIIVSGGFSIAGQISVESSADSTPVKLAGLRVLLRGDPELLTSGTAQPGAVSETGSFTLENVAAGEYRVDVAPILDLNAPAPAAPEAFVESIRYGDTDVLNGSFRIDAAPEAGTTLKIVISNKWGSASGTVLDSGSKPSVASTVVVVPDPDHRRRRDLFKSVTTDASGRFQFNRLAPGVYKMFAWEEVDPGIWNDAAFMSRYEDRGKEIRIGEGGNGEIQLTVIPASEK